MQKWLWSIGLIGVAVAIIAAVVLVKDGEPSPVRGDLAVAAADWTAGKTGSTVTLAEYSDFECPACAAWEPHLRSILHDYGDRILFVYRHFPLSQHAYAELSARSAEAAGMQGKFWEMHDRIFDAHPEWAGQASARTAFSGLAEGLGLDRAQFERDWDSETVREAVRADFESGIRFDVNSTPTFFINGQKVEPRSPEELRNFLDEALGF